MAEAGERAALLILNKRFETACENGLSFFEKKSKKLEFDEIKWYIISTIFERNKCIKGELL